MSIDLEALGLPPDARIDLAYRDTLDVTAVPSPAQRQKKIPGEFYFVPISYRVSITTDATAGVRTPVLELGPRGGSSAYAIPASSSLNPSSGYSLTWAIDVSAMSIVVNYLVMPLPPIVMAPGDLFTLTIFGNGPGDTTTGSMLTGVCVPSGPKLHEETELVPTPLVL